MTTIPGSAPGILPGSPSPSRRADAGALLATLRTGTDGLARLYRHLSTAATPEAVRPALAAVARAKAAEAAGLAALGQALGAPEPPAPAGPPPPAGLEIRGEGLAAAYRQERVLEEQYREILALLEDEVEAASAEALAAAAAADRRQVLGLYLRYS